MFSSVSPAELPPMRLDRWLTPIPIIYSIFVLYGSLVPLNIRPLGMTEALAQFSRIPYLSLDTFARADWVANILLGSVRDNRNLGLSWGLCARVGLADINKTV